jgi:uncharacterized membrane protein
MGDVIFALTLILALGSGLTAGWFFAYSDHVMKALGRRPEAEGITTMKEINVIIERSPMAMAVLFVPTLTGIALAVLSVVDWDEPEVFYHLAGSALYVVGTVGVTMVFNVPRNNALAAAEPASAAGADVWQRYLREWTFWNHVRTVAAFAAAALLTVALAEM